MKTILGMFALAVCAVAQVRTIAPGTSLAVRTNEPIDARQSDGRVYTGVVVEDVLDESGRIAIPRGAEAELIVKNTSGNVLALDLESVTADGQRYSIVAEADSVAARREGVGANRRTGEYVGGGALLGTIIGAIAGGGKGAAIGAAAGAAAGAGTQVMTRGTVLNIPAESLLTFRLEQPLQLGIPDRGFTRDGRHYHPGWENNAYSNASNAPSLVSCSSNRNKRVYCEADTRGGVRLVRQVGGARCRQGSTWGYDARGIWVARGCAAEFEVGPIASASNQNYNGNNNTSVITCSSANGLRNYCVADTQTGIRLRRQLSSAPCQEGSTWGYDARGIWVDRGCRAEFEVAGNAAPNNGRYGDNYNTSSTITCASDNGQRTYCTADTRSGVRILRQLSGSPCEEGSTWGYDSRGVWVDRGCRAEFDLRNSAGR